MKNFLTGKALDKFSRIAKKQLNKIAIDKKNFPFHIQKEIDEMMESENYYQIHNQIWKKTNEKEQQEGESVFYIEDKNVVLLYFLDFLIIFRLKEDESKDDFQKYFQEMMKNLIKKDLKNIKSHQIAVVRL